MSSYKEVIEYIMLGATTVQLCTAIMWNGYETVTRIIRDLERWMDEKGYQSFEEIRGIALKDIKTVEELAKELPKFAHIDKETCVGCGTCKKICMYCAIEEEQGTYVARKDQCDGCGMCAQMYPAHAISLSEA